MTSVAQPTARAAVSFAPTLALALALGLSLSACSISFGGDGSVSAADLATQLDPQLQEKKGEGAEVKDLRCDGDLEAVVGEEQRCHFTDRAGDRYGLSVTVTEVSGGDVSFGVEVDPGQTVEPDELEPELIAQLSKPGGAAVIDDVTCPDDLPGIVGATTTCVVTVGEDRLETLVTVTSAEASQVGFDVEVDPEPLS